MVLEDIHKYAKMLLANETHMYDRISKKMYGETALNYEQLNATLEEHKTRLGKLDMLIEKLFEERFEGVVSDNIFHMLISKYENEYNDCKETIQNIEKELRNPLLNGSKIHKWISLVKEHIGLQNLNAQILISLVERIIISDVPKGSKKSIKNVTNIYNHVGDLSWLAFEDEESK